MPDTVRLLIFLISFSAFHCSDSPLDDRNTFFQKNSAKGACIVKEVSSSDTRMYNEPRCDSPFLPASSFKVRHSLIALQTGAVQGIGDTIPWDGLDRGWDQWNRDQTMTSTLPVS